MFSHIEARINALKDMRYHFKQVYEMAKKNKTTLAGEPGLENYYKDLLLALDDAIETNEGHLSNSINESRW